jgi:energy-coupling factor transporter ATP-binding protein EcfA2
MEISLENVRCLCEEQTLRVKPLTFLVGENSTGKSTFLAMLAHISQPGFPSFRPDFNTPPYDLGTFDSIATYKGGRYGRADHFVVGFKVDEDTSRSATYINEKGQPQLKTYKQKDKDEEFAIELDSAARSGTITFSRPSSEESMQIPLDLTPILADNSDASLNVLVHFALARGPFKANPESLIPSRVLRVGSPILPPTLSLGPIRAKPRRTYDEFRDEFTPEGDHRAVMLARLWQEDDQKKRLLVEALTAFGVDSALFQYIDVRRLGKGPTDPFQLLVRTAGPSANLVDVGYGVSQVLPLVVQTILATKRRRVLLQQPEVHLHPKGQAALGTFFSKMVAHSKKEFVIETHSDYLLDRVRLEVARGTLRPEDVGILFFEKAGMVTHVHLIEIDGAGNVVDSPESYRSFFLEEEMNLFSRVKQ